MAQGPVPCEFEASIDFLGRPRASSALGFYGPTQISGSYYSPSPSHYSADGYMTPNYSVSELDFEISYQQSINPIPRSNGSYIQRERCTGPIRQHLDRARPPISHVGYESRNNSPTWAHFEIPLTPQSSTEGPMLRTFEVKQSHKPQAPVEAKGSSSQAGKNSKESKLDENSKQKPQPPKKRRSPTGPKPEKPKVPKLDRPLSELTKDLVHIPLRDMDRWVHRSIEERRREVVKRDGHVARPMNSFMLYRSAFAERTKHWCLQNNHQVVSSVSGASWPLEPSYIREKYNELARIERINHQAAHPGYKFSPSKNQIPVRRRKSSSDTEDESEEVYSTEMGEVEDRAPEPAAAPPQPIKKKQKAMIMGKKQEPTPSPAPSPAKRAIMIQQEPVDMNSEIRLQTGAQKSSYDALNPGRPRPLSMVSGDMTGSYYQTVVRPAAATTSGNSMIEDVTIRKTPAPMVTTNFLDRAGSDISKYEEVSRFQSQPSQQVPLPQERPVGPKQDPTLIEQMPFTYSHETTPELVDMEYYQGLLNQQILQNLAAQQSLEAHQNFIRSQNEIVAPYPFVSPGIGYSSATPSVDLEHAMSGVVGHDDIGISLWPGIDENGNVLHSDPANNFQYDEWLMEQ